MLLSFLLKIKCGTLTKLFPGDQAREFRFVLSFSCLVCYTIGVYGTSVRQAGISFPNVFFRSVKIYNSSFAFSKTFEPRREREKRCLAFLLT